MPTMATMFKGYVLLVGGIIMWASSASAGSGCPIHAVRAAFATPVTTLRRSMPTSTPWGVRAAPRAAPLTMAATMDNMVTKDIVAGAKKDNLARLAAASKPLVVHAIGVSIHHADVSVREKLAAPETQWNNVSSQIIEATNGAVEEVAVLSTCNRFEVYFTARDERAGMFAVTKFLADRSGLPMRFLRESLFMLSDDDAIWHLLRVAAGLDSLVIGEGQILSQVRQCFLHAADPGSDGETIADGADEPEPYRIGGSGGKVLSRLLNTAVVSGKRAREETDISKGAVSISSAAYEFSHAKAPSDLKDMPYADAKVAIVGAGTMTRLLLTHMASHGTEEATLVSRSRAPAQALADGYESVNIDVRSTAEDGEAAMWDAIAAADIVYASTSAPGIIINADETEKELEARGRDTKARPLMFVDISMPRNVDDECNNIPGVTAYNVDHLKAVVARNTAKRRKEMLEAEELLHEEHEEFSAWHAALGAVPAINKLQDKAEEMRLAEYKKANKKLKNLSEKEVEAVNRLSRGIVNKLLHGPLSHLRKPGSNIDEAALKLESFRGMFDLDDE